MHRMFRSHYTGRRFCDQKCCILCPRALLAVCAPRVGANSVERDGAASQRRLCYSSAQGRAGGFEHGEFPKVLRGEVSRYILRNHVTVGVGRNLCLVGATRPSGTAASPQRTNGLSEPDCLLPENRGSSMVGIKASIAKHPASGTSNPARRLPVPVDARPTSQGMTAPPKPASANIIAPMRLDLS